MPVCVPNCPPAAPRVLPAEYLFEFSKPFVQLEIISRFMTIKVLDLYTKQLFYNRCALLFFDRVQYQRILNLADMSGISPRLKFCHSGLHLISENFW